MGLNHIFKVIWSKSKNAWVVVSELACNEGKTKTVRAASKGLLAVAVISALGGGVASADYDPGTESVYISDDSIPKTGMTRVVKIGYGGYVGGSDIVSIGGGHTGSQYAIAIGASSRAGNLGFYGSNEGAIAIGNSARSWNSSTGLSIGRGANASDGEYSIAMGVSANTNGSADSIAIGHTAYAGTLGKNRIAIGTSSHNDADDSIAIGGGTLADGERGVVIGAGARASGESSTALGAGANTDSIANSVALGSNSMSTAYVQPIDTTINGIQLKSTSFAGIDSSLSTVSLGNGISGSNVAQRQIKNVAAGVVSATSTDAINGSQLYAAIDAISKAGTGSGTGATTLNVAGDNGSTSSVNLGTQSFNITGTDGIVTNASGNGITIGLDAATQAKINNATSNGADKDLSNITPTGEQKIKDTAAWNVQVNRNAAEKVQGGDTVAFKDGKNISITNTGKDITVATASTVDFDKVTVGGTTGGVTIDGTTKTIGGLNNATTNDQAVNLGQVKALINTSTVGTSSINYKVNSGTAQATSLVDGFDFSGDNNIQIAADTATTGKINYTLNPNLTGIQSIGGGTSASNGPTITFNNPAGGTPSVGVNSTLDMGGNKITNLQDGTIAAGSKEGVNGGQLFDVKTDLENKINTISTASPAGLSNRIDKLSDRIDKVGAGSAALAALHPLDFHPDDKWTVSAGYGHYRGASAGAVGAFYRPNEDTLFSISGTLGNGDTQMNAGVNFRIGKKSPTSRTTVAMGREMAEMNARMQELENSNKELRRVLTMLLDPSKAAEFPDVPKDHWAYQYISQLAGNGIITGYPDGTFKGDKTMTRYEVATIIYRALQNGAPMDANMERAVTEFAPELQNIRMKHFRVDRISGDDNDRQKVERVRVNNENTSNSDVYGSRIVK